MKCGQGLSNRNLNDSPLKCVTHEAIILGYDVQVFFVCQSAPQDQTVKGAALQVSERTATYVVQLRRSVQNWMKIRYSCGRQEYSLALGVGCATTPLPPPILLTSIHVTTIRLPN
jgi:hypothetical protein